MASDNMATAHFDGTPIHSANNLTVYLDGVKICSYDGGRTCSVKVKPGSYIMRVLVYNDASEDAYWLGPFSSDFEPGMEYDITFGKSGYEGMYERANGSYRSSNAGSGSSGCFGWLVLIIIAAALVSGVGSHTSSFLPSSSRGTNQTQVTEQVTDMEQAENPPEEVPDDPEDEQSGFIFPNSDTDLIEQWEIEGLSDSDLTYAINEIYARHGYIFRNDALRGYYEQFSWYRGEVSPDDFSTDIFNQIEQQNWNLLVNERGARKASD